MFGVAAEERVTFALCDESFMEGARVDDNGGGESGEICDMPMEATWISAY